jgi:hypothetical protein
MSQRSTEVHAPEAHAPEAHAPEAHAPETHAPERHAPQDQLDSTRDGDGESKRPVGEIRSIDSARAQGGDQNAARQAEVAGPPQPDALEAVSERLGRLERHNRLLRYMLAVLVVFTGYISMDKLFPDGVIVQKTMLESKELKLLDGDGNARLFLRMYSRVPVLQLVDGNGKPRLSLGLRFDDTPFIDLSDSYGNTRATLEMTEQDAPALRLFDGNGDVTFQIK